MNTNTQAPIRLTRADLKAKQAACDWHSGQWTPLYALCSSGAIVEGIEREITHCYPHAMQDGTDYTPELDMLAHYCQSRGKRDAVPNWSDLRW